MYGIISTWRMGLEGVEEAQKILENKGYSGDALEIAIKNVEDFPYYKSVGYGGLPNEEMEVELDAAYMNGDTLSFGAIGAIKDFANPISIARSLSHLSVNNILVAQGAEKYASMHNFERKVMLSDRAKIHYHNRLKQEQELSPYNGHDTVGMVCLDMDGHMTAGTSTSGLFMKKKGRIGDSPIIGSGFYVDSTVGGATCTGLGEDLMKGCLSYQIIQYMKDGFSVQAACDKAIFLLEKELIQRRGKAGDLSVVAMNNQGEFGASSTIDGFSVAIATQNVKPTVYLVKRKDQTCFLEQASQEWLDDYMNTRLAPLKEL